MISTARRNAGTLQKDWAVVRQVAETTNTPFNRAAFEREAAKVDVFYSPSRFSAMCPRWLAASAANAESGSTRR